MKTLREFDGTGVSAVADADGQPHIKIRKKKRKIFDVPNHVFEKLKDGKIKFERWSKYLEANEAVYERQIISYLKANRNNEVVLRNQVTGESKVVTVVEKTKGK